MPTDLNSFFKLHIMVAYLATSSSQSPVYCHPCPQSTCITLFFQAVLTLSNGPVQITPTFWVASLLIMQQMPTTDAMPLVMLYFLDYPSKSGTVGIYVLAFYFFTRQNLKKGCQLQKDKTLVKHIPIYITGETFSEPW